MSKTRENQKKAQEKYLANPENRAKKMLGIVNISKHTYIYEAMNKKNDIE